MTSYTGNSLYINFEYIPERKIGWEMRQWYDYMDRILGDLYHMEENLDNIPKIRLNTKHGEYDTW